MTKFRFLDNLCRPHFVGICLLAATTSFAQAASTTVDLSQLKDQHENTFTHTERMEYLLLANGMSSKKLIDKTLKTVDNGCLQDGRVVYLANISGMPSLITKMFALPKMRKAPYPIWLDRDGSISDNLPSKDDSVSMIQLNNAAIADTQFYKAAEPLQEKLAGLCGMKSGTKK